MYLMKVVIAFITHMLCLDVLYMFLSLAVSAQKESSDLFVFAAKVQFVSGVPAEEGLIGPGRHTECAVSYWSESGPICTWMCWCSEDSKCPMSPAAFCSPAVGFPV